MSTRELVRNSFIGKIDSFEFSDDVKSFLKSHEKLETCIDNLCSEITKIELTKAIQLDRERVQRIGSNFASTFSKIALGAQERKHMTEMKKSLERKAHEEMVEAEQFYKDNVEEGVRVESVD